MSEDPNDLITDYEYLYARQVTHRSWRVLNIGRNPSTVNKVDLDALTCTCGDFTWRKESGEACKHISKALFEARQHVRVEEELVNDLSLAMSELNSAIADLSGQGSETETMPAGEALDTGPSEDTETAETEDDTDHMLAADRLEDWLETAVPTPEHVDLIVGSHDGPTGVQVHPDNGEMADHQYEAFKGVVNSLDGSEVHVGFGDDPCQTCGQQDDEFYYWVPADVAMEVGGE